MINKLASFYKKSLEIKYQTREIKLDVQTFSTHSESKKMITTKANKLRVAIRCFPTIGADGWSLHVAATSVRRRFAYQIGTFRVYFVEIR